MVEINLPLRPLLAGVVGSLPTGGPERPDTRTAVESPQTRAGQNLGVSFLPKLLIIIRSFIRLIFVRVFDAEIRHEGSRAGFGLVLCNNLIDFRGKDSGRRSLRIDRSQRKP